MNRKYVRLVATVIASAVVTVGLATGASALGGALPMPKTTGHSAPIDLAVYAPRAV